jgi:hypothetical protein
MMLDLCRIAPRRAATPLLIPIAMLSRRPAAHDRARVASLRLLKRMVPEWCVFGEVTYDGRLLVMLLGLSVAVMTVMSGSISSRLEGVSHECITTAMHPL